MRTEGEWTQAEIALMASAVSRAPSVHNTQPWVMETAGRTAALYERFDVRLPQHDPAGRDRLISCGAAVTNLRLAVRRLGWSERWTQFGNPPRPDEVARVTALDRVAPTSAELTLFHAISARRSHRGRFAGPAAAADVAALKHASTATGLSAHVVHGSELGALASRLRYAATVLQGDRAYLRELTGWTAEMALPDGIPLANLPAGALPWTGLVNATTHIPDDETLAARLGEEALLVLITVGDGRSDHLHAGMALQEVWLAATARGLAASVLTQPLHLHEVRAGLIEAMELPGYPQAILRVGQPADAVPPTPRRPLSEVVRAKGSPS